MAHVLIAKSRADKLPVKKARVHAEGLSAKPVYIPARAARIALPRFFALAVLLLNPDISRSLNQRKAAERRGANRAGETSHM